MTHSELVELLVEDQLTSSALRVVWAGTAIGSRWLEGGKVPVPDVLTMKKSYTKPDVTIFEVKASRSDFRADVGKGKYRRYLDVCTRLLFAAPKGLLKREEIPEGVGLIVYNADKKTWATVVAGRRRECDLDRLCWQSLLFANAAQQREERRLRDRMVCRENAELHDHAVRVGLDLRKWDEAAKINSGAAEVVALLEETFGGRHNFFGSRSALRDALKWAKEASRYAPVLDRMGQMLREMGRGLRESPAAELAELATEAGLEDTQQEAEATHV